MVDKKKCLIIITGEKRTFLKTNKFFFENLINCNPEYFFDILCILNNESVENISEFYCTDHVFNMHEEYSFFLKNSIKQFNFLNFETIEYAKKSFFPQIFSWNFALNKIKLLNMFDYDICIRTRYDILIKEKIILKNKQNNISSGAIYFPNELLFKENPRITGGANDQLYISNMDNMIECLGLINNFEEIINLSRNKSFYIPIGKEGMYPHSWKSYPYKNIIHNETLFYLNMKIFGKVSEFIPIDEEIYIERGAQ